MKMRFRSLLIVAVATGGFLSVGSPPPMAGSQHATWSPACVPTHALSATGGPACAAPWSSPGVNWQLAFSSMTR